MFFVVFQLLDCLHCIVFFELIVLVFRNLAEYLWNLWNTKPDGVRAVKKTFLDSFFVHDFILVIVHLVFYLVSRIILPNSPTDENSPCQRFALAPPLHIYWIMEYG